MTFSDPAMLKHFKKDINDILSNGVDLLFCNEMELLLWANTDSIEVGCNLMEEKARQFVVTQGADGALLFDGKDYISVESHKVNATIKVEQSKSESESKSKSKVNVKVNVTHSHP